MELYDENNMKIRIDLLQIDANPKDLNSIPGYNGDYRTLDKLIDGINNTTDDKHMWMIPFNRTKKNWLTIMFPKQRYISSIKFYNYNKSLEDTSRGIKTVVISFDKKLLTPKRGITISKAQIGRSHV